MLQSFEKRGAQDPSAARFTALRAHTLLAFIVVATLDWRSPRAIAAGLSESVHSCAQLADDAKRLACYDDAAGRAQAPADKAPAASTKTPAKATQITASITQITRSADGRYVITLDNGQIWSEAQSKQRFNANTGDTVTIWSGLLGARYLRTTSGTDVLVIRQP